MSASNGVTIPIAVLKVGETRSIMTNLEFPDAPVNFKLIQGSGPVYIHGNQVPVFIENVENGEEAEDEMEVVVVSSILFYLNRKTVNLMNDF